MLGERRKLGKEEGHIARKADSPCLTWVRQHHWFKGSKALKGMLLDVR